MGFKASYFALWVYLLACYKLSYSVVDFGYFLMLFIFCKFCIIVRFCWLVGMFWGFSWVFLGFQLIGAFGGFGGLDLGFYI